MQMRTKTILLSLAALLIIGCAKEKEYDTVYKEPDTHSLNEFLTTSEDGKPTKYLYVPMTLGTPREVAEANPFYQGQVKLVNLEFTEAGLAVHEIESDDRFSENDLNRKPVMLIPGEYKSYQCKEDQYGDCTNAEEENTEVTWDKKKYFIPNFKDLSVQEVNMLDLVNVDGDSCITPLGVELVDYEISKKGVVNIELEKTYKLNKSWKCIRSNYFNDKLSANSFKVRFFYSMVKLENLASKDYEPLHYPIPDHDVYGFFKSENKKLNGDFDRERENITYLANRWNPKKKVLRYYLSKSYNKESNKAILEATMNSMKVMNKNLKAAGANFQLEFIQQTDDMNISPGDLRYNSIVIIDDPRANGLLGYAPSVKNPETGEIVQAHINMYGGVLRSGTRFVYEGAIDIMKEQKAAREGKLSEVDNSIRMSAEALKNGALPIGLVPRHFEADSTGTGTKILNKLALAGDSTPATHHDHSESEVAYISEESLAMKEKARMLQKIDLKQRYDDVMSGAITGIDEVEKKIIEQDLKEKSFAYGDEHTPEFFPIAGTKKVVYPALLREKDLIGKDGILKPWDELTQKQQDKVAEIIVVNRYISTFVHEMGHSLGLRHNFAGSTDGKNFYSDTEAQVLGMVAAPAYSSVMDYAFSEYNELGAFGKYDVAALMYAYSGRMQTSDGNGVTVEDSNLTLREIIESHNANSENKIVEFEYCTDENASLSTSCNRFDEGTTLVEIAKHRIDRYNKFYRLRNFRNGRTRFSSYDDDMYFISRYREFFQTRDILEDYEFYAGIFGKQTMVTGCSTQEEAQYPICKQIRDRINAVNLVGDFFLEVLKTPELICAVAKEDKPKVVVEYKKLIDIYNDIKWGIRAEKKYSVTTCFDESVKKKLAEDKLVVVGENGRFMNGFKDTNPIYKYVSDREVRGVWADKVMAYRMLFQRRSRSSTTDTDHMALIDVPSIRAKVENYLKHVVLGKPLDNPVPFKTEDGKIFKIPYVIGNDYQIDQMEDSMHWIKEYLGMKDQGKSSLTEILLNQTNHIGTYFSDDVAENIYATSNLVSVRKDRGFVKPSDRIPGLEAIFSRGVTYQMGPENMLAFFMAKSETMAPMMSKLGQEKLIEIYKTRVNPDAPVEMEEAHKLFWGVTPELQQVIINNAIAAKVDPKEKFPKAAFVQTFGAVNGPILYQLFDSDIENGAATLKEIVSLKDTMMTVPSETASAEEKAMYELDVNTLAELIQDFMSGAMNSKVFEFYKTQLRKLPNHFDYANI